MSDVTCHLSHVFLFYFFSYDKYLKKISLKKYGQSGGASWWRVCYQLGILRLVSKTNTNLKENLKERLKYAFFKAPQHQPIKTQHNTTQQKALH